MLEPTPLEIVTGRCSLCSKESPTLHGICRSCTQELFVTELRRRTTIEKASRTRSKHEGRAIMVEAWLAGEQTREQQAEFGKYKGQFVVAVEQGLKATRAYWWERNKGESEGRIWLREVCPICTARIERLGKDEMWGPLMKAAIGTWRRHGENARLEETPPNGLYVWANRWVAPLGKDGGFRAPCGTAQKERESPDAQGRVRVSKSAELPLVTDRSIGLRPAVAP